MAGSKTSLTRDSTMRTTAKDAIAYLYPKGQSCLWPYVSREEDKDLLRSQGLLQTNSGPAPSPSKPSLQRDSTMAQTAKEARSILGKNMVGGTRQATAKGKSKTSKAAFRRGDTISKTVEEAKVLLGEKAVDITEGRKTRSGSKAGQPKPAVKRAGTMQKTAKEGKSYLNRIQGKGKKGKGKK